MYFLHVVAQEVLMQVCFFLFSFVLSNVFFFRFLSDDHDDHDHAILSGLVPSG